MHWDDEVDLVSVGSGSGGLACAIVAVDAGQTVFVAHPDPPGESPDPAPPGQRPNRSAPPGRPTLGIDHLGIDSADVETNAYLDSVTEILASARPGTQPVDVPVQMLAELAPLAQACKPRRHTVEPFVGARLGQWAADCLAASHGVFYSRVTGRNMATVRSEAGERFEAAVVGSLAPGVAHDGRAIGEWLSEQARGRGIDVLASTTLKRLVFEGGRVVGAVVRTPHGSFSIAARVGVVLATTSLPHTIAGGDLVRHQGSVQVCVVSRTASRFARLELQSRARVTGRAAASSAPRSQGLNTRARRHTFLPGQLRDGGCEL